MEVRMTLTLCGYQVFVQAAADAFPVTCPELPQLSVTSGPIGRALSLAEGVIDAIPIGRLARRTDAYP